MTNNYMKNTKTLLAACLIAAALSQGQAGAQMPGFPRMNMDSLNALTANDHANMMGQLGLTSVRPGRDGYSTDPAIGANYNQYIANPYPVYPELLTTFDGKPVKNAKTWMKVRRPELIKAYEDEVYGHIPANVPDVTWKVVKEEKVMMGDVPCISRDLAGVVDNSSCPEISVTIEANIVWPESAGNNLPVIVEYGFGRMMGNFSMPGMPKRKSFQEQVVERGWAAATIVPTSYQADGGHGLRRGIIGLCNKGDYRKPSDWGTLRAWGWGTSRLLDYFEGEAKFDATKVAIEGNSRYGKTALVTGVFDERIAAVFASSSGKGGAAPWRRYCGEALENLTSDGEYHWMAGNFIKYGSDPLTADDLPVEQHELIALMAPRLVLISAGQPGADQWQDLIGMFMAAYKASPAFELFGDPGIKNEVFPGTNVGVGEGAITYRMHDGGHEPGPNWPYFLDRFDKLVVKGK